MVVAVAVAVVAVVAVAVVVAVVVVAPQHRHRHLPQGDRELPYPLRLLVPHSHLAPYSHLVPHSHLAPYSRQHRLLGLHSLLDPPSHSHQGPTRRQTTQRQAPPTSPRSSQTRLQPCRRKPLQNSALSR